MTSDKIPAGRPLSIVANEAGIIGLQYGTSGRNLIAILKSKKLVITVKGIGWRGIYFSAQKGYEPEPGHQYDIRHDYPALLELLKKNGLDNKDNVRKRASPQGSTHKWTSS